MKKLLIYMKKFRKECILAPLFKLLEAAFELFVPLIVAAIIDNGIDGKSKSFIINMGLLLLHLRRSACSVPLRHNFSRQRLQSASAPTFAPLC